jgi:hypothetical protein
VFYVLAGTMSVLVGTEWIEAGTGSFVVLPGHVTHDFENRGTERAGVHASRRQFKLFLPNERCCLPVMTHGSSAGGFSSVPVLSERIDEIAGAFVGKQQVRAVDLGSPDDRRWA